MSSAPHAAGQVDGELQHIGPDHRLEAAEPGVDHRTMPITTIAVGTLQPVTRASGMALGEDADGVAQEAGHQEDERREPPGADAEARLEPRVGRLLLAPEVARAGATAPRRSGR